MIAGISPTRNSGRARSSTACDSWRRKGISADFGDERHRVRPMHDWFDSLAVIAVQAIVAFVGASFSAWAYVDAKHDLRAAEMYDTLRLSQGDRRRRSNVIPHLIAAAHVKRERITTIVQVVLTFNALSGLFFPLPDLHANYQSAEMRILINRALMIVVTVLLTYKSIQSRYDRHAVLEVM